MRYTFAKFLSPAVDVVEHSTVIAIGVQFMIEHWANAVVLCAVIAYVAIHAFIARVR